MANITYRSEKGSPLTNSEIDNNFFELEQAIANLPTSSGSGSGGSWVLGASDPDSENLPEGFTTSDVYLNTTSGDYFSYDGTTFTSEGNLKGPQGEAGTPGAPGADGADGVDGLPGVDGAPGADGSDGIDGADGSVWFTGTADPVSVADFREETDLFLNTSTGDVFKLSGGSWAVVGNLKGPQGDPGADGVDGADGTSGSSNGQQIFVAYAADPYNLPAGIVSGDLFLQTYDNTLKQWNGTSFDDLGYVGNDGRYGVQVWHGNVAAVQDGLKANDLFFQRSDSTLHRYNGSSFVEMGYLGDTPKYGSQTFSIDTIAEYPTGIKDGDIAFVNAEYQIMEYNSGAYQKLFTLCEKYIGEDTVNDITTLKHAGNDVFFIKTGKIGINIDPLHEFHVLRADNGHNAFAVDNKYAGKDAILLLKNTSSNNGAWHQLIDNSTGNHLRFRFEGLGPNGYNETTREVIEMSPQGRFLQYTWMAEDCQRLVKTGVRSGATTFTRFMEDGDGSGSFTTVGSLDWDGSNMSLNSLSDVRAKENIAPAQDAGGILDAVEIVEYDFKKNGNHVPFGVVAQDLHAVFPDAVSVGDAEGVEDIEKPWLVNQTAFIPLLIKEIQGLRKRVAELEAA